MKRILFPVFCLLTIACYSQAGMWTWIKGDTIANAPAVYGTKGVEAPANKPQAFYEAEEWTDTAGNFWLFSGVGSGFLRDLWKFNPVTNNWTWVKGPGTAGAGGSYGIQGVPDSANNPPALGWGTPTWSDLNGDLWLFGGGAGTGKAALWRYNIASNIWTWMNGPAGAGPGVYGTKGVPAAANYPPNRFETSATWVDAFNNLWLFGGQTSSSAMNDLWRYNIATNMWTWMKGSATLNSPGVYGIKGVEDSANVPGARASYATWVDKNSNFWLFGGEKYNRPLRKIIL